MIGELIDHYRVLELIGRGAMGVVYKALDVNLDRPVAMKVMSAEVRSDPEFVERFRQEARLQATLNHPNVAQLYDYFVHDGAPVAVMEFIDGESLEQLIRRRGAIPAHECLPTFKQALRGVAAAHRAGIVHRDLKPSNLMVTREDIVKVMDFGIAKRQGVTGATKVSSTSIGSPLYMAPEQILGRAVDCRTDIYALGITLYELLSAHRPFNTRGKAEYLVLDAHVNEEPEPPTVYRHGIPQPIVDAVMRSLAKDPDARFQSADDFIRALPDLPTPAAAAPPIGRTDTVILGPKAAQPRVGPTGTVATPRLGPTGTMALQPGAVAPQAGPTGTMALPRAAPSATVALEFVPSGTMPLEHAPTKRIDSPDSMAFDFSAGTVWQQLHPPLRSASSPASTPSPPAAAAKIAPRATRAAAWSSRSALVAALVAALALGLLVRYAGRSHTAPETPALVSTSPPVALSQVSTATETSPSPEPPAPAPEVSGRGAESAAVAPAEAAAAAAPTTPAAPTVPPRLDLSGTWRGEYVDASGKQLLRVVSLSISRVHDDGGIEGTLQYQAASGEGECKLYPRGSSYSAGARRLQLSPESCTPHYPRELGVPLDFVGVNPRANMLRDGRIEAPTGEVIRVRLRRVSGV